ncbi:MAG TPA: LysR family transcriptional regulator [Aggregatilinea sp.]|uniref:LysR family transcriptional regulator n=1 Tax=Aggregatilinea sp. TaxID=2806333 RepID=UPI002C88D463|nr:LysR family transcriptional regulator [Aggregatilinea sp.]HML24520.1 LysR family transcriptional regulator [Aggregatilinea sp.]
MEVNYLHEFLAIERLGSFTLAAEELFISQSSLSKHIKVLEKELGVELFDRTTRNVVLSDAAELILPYAKELCSINNALLGAVAEHNRRERSVINVVSIPVMAQYEITRAIARFQKENPNIVLTVIEREPNEIGQLLESGECDLAFIRRSAESASNLDFVAFCEDYLVAVLPETHYLSEEKEIELSQLSNEGHMFLDKATMLYGFCYNLCLDAGYTPNVVYTGCRPENIIALVSQGMGVALLMKRHTDYSKRHNVTCVDIKPTVKSAVGLAKVKNRKVTAAVQRFWNYIADTEVSGTLEGQSLTHRVFAQENAG